MTFKQLKKAEETYNKIMDNAYDLYKKKERQYIEEHAPLKVEPGEWINIRLQVTEESRERLTPKYRDKPRYRLGHRHTVRGRFLRWLIYDGGELRPDLMGSTYYPPKEKIISITKSKKQ